jgi:hypothetical protein
MKKIAFLVDYVPTREALIKFFHHSLEYGSLEVPSLANPYNQRGAYQKALECDILLACGSLTEYQKNFQFVKAIGKRSLLLFYSWEMNIETEGPFWLALPEGLDRLAKKVLEMMERPPAKREEFEELEKCFPQLREGKGHHR